MRDPLHRIDARRRTRLLSAAMALLIPAAGLGQPRVDPNRVSPDRVHLASGLKIGEVTPTSAIVWVRLTRQPLRRSTGLELGGRPASTLPEGIDVDRLEGAVPGLEGQVRLRYSATPDFGRGLVTDWVDVSSGLDYSTQFELGGLVPGTRYVVAAETRSRRGGEPFATFVGRFTTAPRSDQRAPILFTAMSCQSYGSRDSPRGFRIYDAMLRLQPHFYLSIGDNVYYDNEAPRAVTLDVARYHWQRMFSLPATLEFLRRVPGYWLKDDHDTLRDDSWPGIDSGEMAPLTFADGQAVFLEQVPMGERTWRRARWGQGLELWLLEGRDYRSPNTDPDGPEKTIWGREQRAWLEKTLAESDADWKLVISPTPIVGPDRQTKADNHANAAFGREGEAVRRWLAQHGDGRTFVVTGDRHWQYHSVDPETGLQELSVGPASDAQAGGSPGEDPEYHRFHRVAGGFLSVEVTWEGERSRLRFRHHDVDGEVVYSFTPDGAAP